MLSAPPSLIAVIGPVEPPLLAAWIRHYRRLGIERFLIAFHFPQHVSADRRNALCAASHDVDVVPAVISTGPWHETTNTRLREVLRALAGPGWHLFADADEFQQYGVPLREITAEADRSGRRVVGGLLLDRVTAHGRLSPWAPEDGLDQTYPLGGHLTHRLLRGDPRKIVLARHDIAVASGNHRAPGHKPDPDVLCAVHHFKWRSGVLDDLRRRVSHFTSGTWEEQTPAVRNEAGRFLAHVEQHSGAINIADPRLAFRHVSLEQLPHGWSGEARRIVTAWRPRTAARC
ncbi:glycosyltransferase family 2 protein [Streptomyces sp. NPDC050315]|uniref:glycosyltransferase family 2 protein n=1 Tax=Streptomyces sp. NPDC050315 TaxID=3155039 RepID=UPI0034486188